MEMCRKFFASICMLAVSGCVALDLGPSGLTNNIAKNAEALNDAHTRSIVSVISKNIYRASERQPTNYTTMSGIKSSPGVEVSSGISLTPIGLGAPSGVLEESVGNLGRVEKSNAEYSINPFSSSNGGNGLYKPVPESVLSDYLAAGWPAKVLLYLFVDSVTFTKSNGDVDGRPFHIDGDKVADSQMQNCTDKSLELVCKFKRIVDGAADGLIILNEHKPDLKDRDCRQFAPGVFVEQFKLQEVSPSETISAIERITGRAVVWGSPLEDKGDKGVYPSQMYLCKRIPAEWRFESTDATPVVHATLRMRSFDDMIYFLGESIRKKSKTDTPESYGKYILFNLYSDGKEAGAEASRIATQQAIKSPTAYLADFRVNNVKYYVAPIGVSGDIPDTNQTDKGQGVKPVDRTGTVLSLLSQLYLRAQSDEFLKAPESTTLRVN